MEPISTPEALRYAISGQMAGLYAVIIVGWLALTAGLGYAYDLAVAGGGAGVVGSVLALVLGVGGLIAVYAGGIGLIYKVIADANATAAAAT
jgi:hypothetical protein